MKESVTIRKSDLERLGKDLMKEIDNFLHDEYILTFPKMKLDQEKFDESVNRFKDKYESGSLDLQEMYDIRLKIKVVIIFNCFTSKCIPYVYCMLVIFI